jgi:hypothetical protein
MLKRLAANYAAITLGLDQGEWAQLERSRTLHDSWSAEPELPTNQAPTSAPNT